MRFLILSDIHGSRPILEKVMKSYDNGHYDMLLLLGDLLNYGPRNGVPEGLDAPGVVEILSKYQKDIVAVRGNCDSEVDQMLLPFPIMSTYAIVADGKHRIFLTHGHIVNEGNLPPKGCCEVFFYGHTHLCGINPSENGGPAICNTGSPTFPKGGNPSTFATLEDGVLSLRLLDGSVLKQLKVY